jgi:hypothetical protein
MFEVLLDFFLLIFSYLGIIYSIHRWVTAPTSQNDSNHSRNVVPDRFRKDRETVTAVTIPPVEVQSPACSDLPEVSLSLYGEHVPEDHVLRRHFSSYVHSMLHELHSVNEPQDVVLLRHYRQWLLAQHEACLKEGKSFQQLLDAYYGSKQVAEVPAEGVHAAVIDPRQLGPVSVTNPGLPTDSILKRHYLTELIRLIEESDIERPTSFDLLRHHEQQISRRLEEQLG